MGEVAPFSREMLKSVVVVVGHALALARAQCTLPADLPEDTQFAAGNPAECVLGAAAVICMGVWQ